MPSQLRRYFCKRCGNVYTTNKPSRLYCSEECRKAHLNERIKGGLALYDLAIASRLDRSADNIANANKMRRYLYQKITDLAQDERARLAKRAARVAEIKAARSNLPPAVEPVDDGSEMASNAN
jgi:endogenous inhibitor of DNA gyrase (YacG/DUF329 family)